MKKSIIISCLFILFLILPTFSQVESNFMRVDQDPSGGYLWFGSGIKAGNTSLVHEIIYFLNSNYLETEIGPIYSFAGGKASICPMIGPLINLRTGKVAYILPQLYIYASSPKMNCRSVFPR